MNITRKTIYKCEKYKAFERVMEIRVKGIDQTLCQEIFIGDIKYGTTK